MAKNGKTVGSKPKDAEEVKEVQIVWVGVDEQPVRAVNQAYSQFDRDGMFVLTLGMANMPPIMGDRKQVKKMVDALAAVTVTPVTRLAMTEGHAESLVRILQKNLKQYRAAKKKSEEKK